MLPFRPCGWYDSVATITATLAARHPALDLEAIDGIVLGCTNQASEDNRSVACTTVNRLCGSGMDAIGIAARQIKAGEADLVVAGDVEGMSHAL